MSLRTRDNWKSDFYSKAGFSCWLWVYHHLCIKIHFRRKNREKDEKSQGFFQKSIYVTPKHFDYFAIIQYTFHIEKCSLKVSFYLDFKKVNKLAVVNRLVRKALSTQKKFLRWKGELDEIFYKQVDFELCFQNIYDLFLHPVYLLWKIHFLKNS
jgi:hypothetical protein